MVMVTGGPRGSTRYAGLPRARDVDASWGVPPDGGSEGIFRQAVFLAGECSC
jgi:hypothetical protein